MITIVMAAIEMDMIPKVNPAVLIPIPVSFPFEFLMEPREIAPKTTASIAGIRPVK